MRSNGEVPPSGGIDCFFCSLLQLAPGSGGPRFPTCLLQNHLKPQTSLSFSSRKRKFCFKTLTAESGCSSITHPILPVLCRVHISLCCLASPRLGLGTAVGLRSRPRWSRPRCLGKRRRRRSHHKGETLDAAECGRQCREGGGGWQHELGYKGRVFLSPSRCWLSCTGANSCWSRAVPSQKSSWHCYSSRLVSKQA